MKNIKFGFCIPVFANPGMLFFRTPAYKKLEWNSIFNATKLCENLGYDSVFIADHLHLGNEGAIYECMAVMAALGSVTTKMSIIPIHLCNNFRHPGVVAKFLSTLSHITNGRVELFYDYGWRKSEFDSYGIDFCVNDSERVTQMAEGIEVIQGMLNNESFSYNGKYYKLENAICNPKPLKKIPLWMGETNNIDMVSEIVKHANVFNSMPCSLEVFKKKCDVLQEECEVQERDFSTLSFSLEVQLLIRDTEEEIEEELQRYRELRDDNNSYDEDILVQLNSTNLGNVDYNSTGSLKKEFLIGTPEVIKEQMAEFCLGGVEHFMIWFMDFPDTKGIEIFSEKVMKNFNL
jgi:alkanesulfonate monooxygenase SsuD/methylene tetrahydromethanopterin reductase-like flavin-dependent oxidoreductase (luciferase family)